MPECLRVNGITLVKALRRLANARGWVLEGRAGKGSHMKVSLNGRRSIIPQHRETLKTGTFRGILKQLAITEDDLEV